MALSAGAAGSEGAAVASGAAGTSGGAPSSGCFFLVLFGFVFFCLWSLVFLLLLAFSLTFWLYHKPRAMVS